MCVSVTVMSVLGIVNTTSCVPNGEADLPSLVVTVENSGRVTSGIYSSSEGNCPFRWVRTRLVLPTPSYPTITAFRDIDSFLSAILSLVGSNKECHFKKHQSFKLL